MTYVYEATSHGQITLCHQEYLWVIYSNIGSYISDRSNNHIMYGLINEATLYRGRNIFLPLRLVCDAWYSYTIVLEVLITTKRIVDA